MCYKIYGLKLKNSKDIKYIGYTSKNIEERLHTHITRTIYYKHKNANWLRKNKKDIEVFLIEDNILDHKMVCDKEKYYIDLYKKMGYDLNNLTEGGDGVVGMVISDETRKKLSIASKGRKMSESAKQKMSESKKGIEKSLKEKMRLNKQNIQMKPKRK